MKILNIKFRKTKKVYPFLINEFQNFQKGDHVIVDTIRGDTDRNSFGSSK